MEIKTNAIVLRTIKYGDSKIIVDLLTRQQGRVSFICRLLKSGKGKIKKQLFQPMTLLELSYDHRPAAKLQSFSDVRMSMPYSSIPFDPYKLSITLFLSEFLTYATRDEQQNEPLYDYIENSMSWLDKVSTSFSNFHLVFMMHLSRFIGFFPNLSGDVEGAWFDLRNAHFCLSQPLHPDCLNPAEASVIGLLMRVNYESMRVLRMSRTERSRCVELILHYYRLHVPNFPELRSLDVLKTLFV